MIRSKHYISQIILGALTCCVFCSSAGAASRSSLYRRDNGDRVPAGLARFFGPRSSAYKYDERMIRAAEIAEKRARSHSTRRCWRYVKNALLAADAVDSYPGTAYAKQAGRELSSNYGFKPIKVADPYDAPVGSVLVYGGRGAGHVEIRTDKGFVSDFKSSKPSKRPLIGVYVKPS
jgi:hypothetical protein